MYPWQTSRLTLTHVYGNAAAKNLTELLNTDSQPAGRNPNRASRIISRQRFHLHGNNKKLLFFSLYYCAKSAFLSSIHLFFSALQLPLNSEWLRGLQPFPGILERRRENILEKRPVHRKASWRQTDTPHAYINICRYLENTLFSI